MNVLRGGSVLSGSSHIFSHFYESEVEVVHVEGVYLHFMIYDNLQLALYVKFINIRGCMLSQNDQVMDDVGVQ